jgi:two-component system chemotaxis response regulator CheY
MRKYDLSNVSVLVIDKSEAMRALFRQLLKELNLGKTTIMSSGEGGLEYFNQDTPDLVLVDWVTDDISGLEVVKEIRTGEESQNQYAAIIMMSGLSSYDSIIRARDSGIHEFLAKPLSPKTLYEKVCHVIEHPRTFVRCDGYFGPDRRRTNKPLKKGVEDRRKGGSNVEDASNEQTEDKQPDKSADEEAD